MKINYFCAENNENYIYSCVKLHTRAALFDSNMHQSRLGLCPRPHWGSLVPPDPLVVFIWPLLRERREEEGRDRAEDRTGGRGTGAERGGPEREGERREGEGPMTLWHGAPRCLNPALSKRRRLVGFSCIQGLSSSATTVAKQ